VHALNPSESANWPDGQAEQLDSPTASAYWPNGQAEQLEESSPEYFPAAQLVQPLLDAPHEALRPVPAEQMEHEAHTLDPSELANWPSGQTEQDEPPHDLVNLPAAQLAHSLPAL
jgi:hypothetical protein